MLVFFGEKQEEGGFVICCSGFNMDVKNPVRAFLPSPDAFAHAHNSIMRFLLFLNMLVWFWQVV